jgi:glycosyltransferase involved in cell wall biosynthesis
MSEVSDRTFDYGALLPGIGVFGGVRRFLEIGNELVRRGHRFTLYHTDGSRPDWLPFTGEVKPLAGFAGAHHQVLLCNDPSLLGEFERAPAELKLFYSVLEKLRNEQAIITNPGWTVLANSSGMQDRLWRKYRVRAEKVVGGISLDVFQPGERTATDGVYRVLSFGRFSRRTKGATQVVRAVEAFARDRNDVKLVLFDHIGFGNERDPRKGFRCSIPYEFILNPTQGELAAMYRSCDVFVSAERRAGWSNTVAESMASGLPVICTRSGTKDLASHKETAWVVPWRHPWFLSRGLKALHGAPELADRMRENALQRVQQFSWPRVVDQLEAVVERKLSRGAEQQP